MMLGAFVNSPAENLCRVCGLLEIPKGRLICDLCALPECKFYEPGAAEGATSDHFGRHITDEQVMRNGGFLNRWPRGEEYGAPVTVNMAPKNGRKGRRKR